MSLKKYQLGGLGSFANIDFSNFESVLEAGRPMVGSILQDSVQADNPEMFANTIAGRIGRQSAAGGAEDYWQQQKDAALAGISNSRLRHEIGKGFDNRKDEMMQEYATTQGATNVADINSGFVDASNFLNLLSGLEFKEGGNLMSKLGYSDNSPFKSLKSINIDGNIIDMSKTGTAILATPDVGEPRELAPYSGTHVFPGAKTVTEVPIKAKGGKPKKWLNKYYQEGGQGAIGAQLEIGEVFATPDANIIDTAATEKHKDMLKDLVTDILGGADYVFSAMDKMKITRKEAEDISFGLGGMLYKEGEIPDMPKEVLLVDLFKEGEDEVQIAEFVKRVRTRYPITDKEDVFSKKANAGNKQSRGPILSAVAFINEKKKGGNEGGGYASTYNNLFNNGISTDANPIKDDVSYSAYEIEASGDPPKGQFGGLLQLLPFVGGIAQGFGQLGAAKNNRNDIAKLLTTDRGLIKDQANSQRGFAGLASAVNLAGVVGQDPTVNAPQFDTTQLDSSIRRAPRSLFDFAAARLAAASKPRLDQLFANSGSFSEAVNLSASDSAANASAIADLGLREMQQNLQLENNYRLAKQGYSDKQIVADTAATNATRGNSNRLIAGAAGALSGGITAQGQITNQEQSALRNNNYQQTQNVVDWRGAKNDAWTNIINNLSGGISSASSSGLLAPKAQTLENVGATESPNPNWVQGPPPVPYETPDYFSLLQPNNAQVAPTQALPPSGQYPRQGVSSLQQQMYGAGYNQSVPGSGWTQDPVTGGWFPPGWVN